MSFEILAVDDSRWTSLYQRLPEASKDVFYSQHFAAVCQETIDHRHQVRCAALSSGSTVLLYPFVERELVGLDDNRVKDLTGLYGRGGIAGHVGDASQLAHFHTALRSYCEASSIICGFDRFHPVTQNHQLAAPQAALLETGPFVIVDLQQPIEAVERHFRHDHRKSIKKAERAGVRVFHERGRENIDAFLQVYRSTLERREAQSFYHFPRQFYYRLVERLPDNILFWYAEHESRIISCELVLHEGSYCHSYLGGTLFEFRQLCANSLLKREIIRHFHAAGCRFFLLGGGATSEDGIARYKSGFSPNGSVLSFVGGTIYDEKAYTDLREFAVARGARVNLNRFQFYDPAFVAASEAGARA